MKLRLLLSVALASYCAVSHAQAPLLKSWARWQFQTSNQTYVPYDSATYVHSGGRNTVADLNQQGYSLIGHPMFDTANVYSYANNAWKQDWHMLRQYNTDDSVTQYDEQTFNGTTQSWHTLNRYTSVYNTNHAVDTLLYQSYDFISNTYANQRLTTYTYDANGKLQWRITSSWQSSTSAWRIDGLDSFWYYTDGKDSVQTNGAYNWLQGGIYQENNRYQYYYDANGRKSKDTVYFGGGVMGNVIGYLYDGSGKLVRDSGYDYVKSQNTYIYKYKTEYTYDTNNDLIQVERFNWDKTALVYVYSYKRFYAYNNYHQLLMADAQNFYNNVWKPDGMLKFLHYEAVNSVSTLPVQTEPMTLYPVPAVSYVTLNLSLTNAQPLRASLVDMQGRIVKQWQETAPKQYTKTVWLSDIPEGVYSIRVQTANGVLSKNFSVIK